MRNQHPDFGRRLRARRRELGISQQQLAGDVVTSSYVSLLESGKRAPTLDVIIHLADRLQMPVEELVGQSIAGAIGAEASASGTVHASVSTTVHDIPPRANGAAAARQSAAPAPAAAELRPPLQILADNALLSNDYARAIELLRTLYDRLRAEGDLTKSVETGFQLQRLLQTQGEHEQRLDLLEELMETAADGASQVAVVALSTELGTALRDTGHLVRARTTLEQATGLLRPTGLHGSSEHVRLLGALVSVLCELSATEAVPDLVTEMLALAENADTPGILGRSQWVAAMAYDQLGRGEEARTYAARARENLPPATMTLRDWLRFCRSTTSILLNTGHLEEAHNWLIGAEHTTSLMNVPAETAALTALRARHQAALGHHERALELYSELTTDNSPLSGLQLARVCLAKAEVLHALNRTAEALEALRAAAAICEENGAYQLALQMWRRMDEIRPS
ncbi:helix-turn-helix domain-containing protein [Streptomyces sp. NPDC051018]|uniref:helix-turn-helix domain-containing protein n=1 Tax=Streptomyces sp. NPDC051018 TaxID=3365639 RepID=UPI00379CAACD